MLAESINIQQLYKSPYTQPHTLTEGSINHVGHASIRPVVLFVKQATSVQPRQGKDYVPLEVSACLLSVDKIFLRPLIRGLYQ